jgi:hypothetical protein
VIALDRETGVRRFAARASDVGRTFPVQIRKYGNRIVYIGELVIAAFDAKTGAKIYRHGLDPVNQLAHMDALNESIESTTNFLSWFTGPLSGWDLKGANQSSLIFDQARVSQDQSRYHAQESARLRHESTSWGNKDAAYKSDIEYQRSKIDSAMADAQFSMGMAFVTVSNMQQGIAAVTGPDRARLEMLLRIRKLLYAANVPAHQGDYVFRTTRESAESGDVSIAVIHLPTGNAKSTKLSGASCKDLGLFSLVDIERGIIYYPGCLTKPKNGSYFIASPVAIPK